MYLVFCCFFFSIGVIGKGNDNRVFMGLNTFRDAEHYSLLINLYKSIRFFWIIKAYHFFSPFSSQARSLLKKESIFTSKCIKFFLIGVIGSRHDNSVFMGQNKVRDAKHYSLHIHLCNYILWIIKPYIFSYYSNARSLLKRESIFTGKFADFKKEKLVIISIF